MIKIVNNTKYKQEQKELKKLREFAFNMYEISGVLTGHTYSYNAMRNLVLEICEQLKKEYPISVKQTKKQIEHIDKIAFHSSIKKDCCINGYDWIFKGIF